MKGQHLSLDLTLLMNLNLGLRSRVPKENFWLLMGPRLPLFLFLISQQQFPMTVTPLIALFLIDLGNPINLEYDSFIRLDFLCEFRDLRVYFMHD